LAFEGLSEKLSAAFKRLRSKGKLTESDVKETMREIRLALLEADVNYKVAKDFVAKVTERAVGSQVLESLTPGQQVVKIVNEEMTALMGAAGERLNRAKRPPSVVMMCGLQGSGKTTHAAKLGKLLRKQGHRPLLVACDIYRPAAIEQLKVLAAQAEVPVFEMGQIQPLKIAGAAIKHARDYGNDYVILDTAGRLHIDDALMDELKGIKESLQPSDILLVVDSMTGQDAVNVAESFDKALGIDGVVLTKLDGDTRGGAALSIRAVTGKPIKFAGTGEKLDEIEPFYPDRMASRILGMGDVLTLIEKAQEDFDEKKAAKTLDKIKKSSFDLDDLMEQIGQIKKMGSLQQILAMIPGAGKISPDDIDDSKFAVFESLINSMTKKERRNPSIINPGRKRRIAAGSGRTVQEVNVLLRQFEQMQKMMKQFAPQKGSAKKGKKGRQKTPFGFGGINPKNFGF
jgi:signal recognition particle subunit SRP54